MAPGYGILGQLGDIVDANEKEANTFLETLENVTLYLSLPYLLSMIY